MERESFENEEIGKIVNEHFVCIKVDREERPDVDKVYKSLIQGTVSIMCTFKKGFPLGIFKDNPDPAYQCNICHLVLRNPVQIFCGHRFCKSCFQDSVRKNGPMAWHDCDLDFGEWNRPCISERVSEAAWPAGPVNNHSSILVRLLQVPLKSQAFPDNATKKEISEMGVCCKLCQWSGKVASYEGHQKECPLMEGDEREDLRDISTCKVQNHFTDPIPPKTNLILETRELSYKVQTLGSALEVFDEEITKMQQKMDVMKRQEENEANTITEHSEAVQKLDTKLRVLVSKDTDLTALEMKMQEMECASFDGTMVWKITDIKQRVQDAVSGKNTSFYSPCFWTSRQGYKMCARIYLNGDGSGKGTHVSLFLVIMKGAYDEILPWPFKQKVTFMLLDQRNGEHITDAYLPDPADSSLLRPTSDFNTVGGCPEFIRTSELIDKSDEQAYVKEDTVFVKVIVDTQNIVL